MDRMQVHNIYCGIIISLMLIEAFRLFNMFVFHFGLTYHLLNLFGVPTVIYLMCKKYKRREDEISI